MIKLLSIIILQYRDLSRQTHTRRGLRHHQKWHMNTSLFLRRGIAWMNTHIPAKNTVYASTHSMLLMQILLATQHAQNVYNILTLHECTYTWCQIHSTSLHSRRLETLCALSNVHIYIHTRTNTMYSNRSTTHARSTPQPLERGSRHRHRLDYNRHFLVLRQARFL